MFIAIELDLQQNGHIDIPYARTNYTVNSMYDLKDLQYGIQLKMI